MSANDKLPDERFRELIEYCYWLGPPVPVEALAHIGAEDLKPEVCRQLSHAGVTNTLIVYAWNAEGMKALAQQCGLSQEYVATLESALSILRQYKTDPKIARGFETYLVKNGIMAIAAVHAQHAANLEKHVEAQDTGLDATILGRIYHTEGQ